MITDERLKQFVTISTLLLLLGAPYALAKDKGKSKALDSATDAVAATKDTPLEVLMVKPSIRDVPEVHQITVTFNKPMIPLGDFEKLAKAFNVTISPKIPCHWRWFNRLTLACQLDHALPPSNEYKVSVPKHTKAYDGTRLKKDYSTTFTTKLWRVVTKRVKWSHPDFPHVFLTFNQPMQVNSLQKTVSSNCGRPKISEVQKREVEELGLDPKRTYLFYYGKRLGLDKSCTLSVAPEARSQHGDVPGIAYNGSFRTYSEFYISQVSCYPDNREKGPKSSQFKIKDCKPDYGVGIKFSSPVLAKDLVGNISVEPHFGWSPGGYGSPEYYRQNPDSVYESIHLRSPLQGRAAHEVVFNNLKDRFGRNLTNTNQVRIETGDYRPRLQLEKNFVVLEKIGPHKIPYQSVNIEAFPLRYASSHRAKDLRFFREFKETYRVCRGGGSPDSSLKETEIKVNLPLNFSGTLPIDLDSVAPGSKYGMFVGQILGDRVIENVLDDRRRGTCQAFFSVVTDLGLLAKVGFYGSAVWVHSIRDATPKSGVKVSLRSYGRVLAKGVTDSKGYVALPGAEKWDPTRREFSGSNKDPLFVVAETDGDFSVLPFIDGRSGIYAHNFSSSPNDYIYEQALSKDNNLIVHAITDRPLYRPGQGVKLKVFARHWEPKSFGLKPALKLQVYINDSKGKKVFDTELKLSEFGTASAEFQLDSSVPLGTFPIYLQHEGRRQSGQSVGSFDVQEFKLPAFKVEVAAAKKGYRIGQATSFLTMVKYHFGGSLAGTEGSYSAKFKGTKWQPKKPKWQPFTFDNPAQLDLPGYEKPVKRREVVLSQGKLTTDKDGEVQQAVSLPRNQIQSFGTLTFESRFKDDRGKTIAGTDTTDIRFGGFQVGLRKSSWVYEAKKPIRPEVVLLDYAERAVAGRKVKLALVHRRYKTIRAHGPGNYFSYQSRTEDKIIDTCEVSSKYSPTSCALTSNAAGTHYVLAEVQDKTKNLIRSSLHLYVTGPEYVGWYRENHDRIDLVPDKKKYQLGEKLRVLVKNPYEEVDALFTLERFNILRKFRKKLRQGAEIVEIPLKDKALAPGFYLSVQLIKGRVSEKLENGVDLGKPSFKMGMTRIVVENPDTVLAIKSTTDRKEYRPGDTVKATFNVRAPSGRNQVELSVAVVDERILQLAKDYHGKYDLHSRFYQLWDVDVQTSQLLTHLMGRRHFGKKGAPSGGDGIAIRVRKNFLPLAYWNPSLRTDNSGRAQISFRAPDNLTGWRLLVVAVDKSHRFGFGGHSFKTNKKLMLEPALPAFLTEGDQFKGRVTVFNRTGRDTTVIGHLVAKSLKLSSPESVEVKVSNQGKGFLEWGLSVPPKMTEANLTVKALAGKHSDAAQYLIPIRPFVSYETFATYGSTVSKQVNVPLKIPGGVRAELSEVDLVLSPTLISHLDDAFLFAFRYPYNCWEQQLVRALMLHHYVELKDYLSISDAPRKPKKEIRDLISKMPKFQTSSGGMSYWKRDSRTVDAYLSVFTALGLTWLKDGGYKVPKDAFQRLLDYVEGLVSGSSYFAHYYNSRSRSTVRAMAVYVLSLHGRNMATETNKLYEERDQLSLFGKSFLWMTANRNPASKKISEQIKKIIFGTVDMTSGAVQFQESLDDGFKRILHTTTRTNCNLLTAMLEEDSAGRFVQPLVRYVIGVRKANRWNNTQENLYCTHALAHYARIYEKDKPKFRVSGSVLDQTVAEKKFQDFKDQPDIQSYRLQPKDVNSEAKLNLEMKGPGRLYYTARLRLAYEDVRQDEVNSGLQVSRKYFTKDKNGKWMPQDNTVNVRRGDLVKVQLKVKVPAVRYQVALADSLPAGLEPLNTSLGGTSVSEAAGESDDSAGSYNWNEDDFWWGFYRNGGFYHREVRLAGMQYFADFLDAGEYELNYVGQAIATGKFNANPSMIEQMYEPEIYGKSTPAIFKIEE